MPQVHALVEQAIRDDQGRMLGALIGAFGDIDLAEDALQDALTSAVARWPDDGVPTSPTAWILTTARHKAIDRLRRNANLERKVLQLAGPVASGEPVELEDSAVEDDRLRLIFTCCHPALSLDARVALTLRLIAGLSTVEIAAGFLIPEPTLEKRLVRAKQKIKQARIPYREPTADELVDRLEAVLAVMYLIFNAGYASSNGPELVRVDLCAEAIRLGRLVFALMPAENEVRGLLALMLLQHSRHAARSDADGAVRTLEDQDRTAWDQQLVAEGLALLERTLRSATVGVYQLQALIAAVHARAPSADHTDWATIVRLYDQLARRWPSPVVALNRAVAVAMWRGPETGLAALEDAAVAGVLDDYYLLHATRADLLYRLGRWAASRDAYRRALELASNPIQQAYFERRLQDIAAEASCTNGSSH